MSKYSIFFTVGTTKHYEVDHLAEETEEHSYPFAAVYSLFIYSQRNRLTTADACH